MLLVACSKWVLWPLEQTVLSALPYSSLPRGPTVHRELRCSTEGHKTIGGLVWSWWDRALEEPQPCLQLGSSCSPQPASLGRMKEGKSTPAPLPAWVLIASSSRDTKYLCKQCVQILTCKCTCDTFMKYAKYDTLGYDLLCVYIWKPFPWFGSGTEHFWQFVWGKQSQSVSMIHYQHIW